MKRTVLVYELVGIIFIIILGSLLHFTFELSDHQAVVGIFSSVNESVWEHLKLAFWPALFFAIIEYRPLKASQNFLFAKGVGIYLMPAIIAVLFYSYTAILGESVFAMDILIFIIAVIVGQFVSYKLLVSKKFPKTWGRIFLVALILLAALFVIFTFYPPHLLIFRDPITGGYGLH